MGQKWDKFNQTYSTQKRRKISFKCIKAGIEVVFRTHTYWYHCKLYRQMDVGL